MWIRKFRQFVVCRNKSLASHENKIADKQTWHQSTVNWHSYTLDNSEREKKIDKNNTPATVYKLPGPAAVRNEVTKDRLLLLFNARVSRNGQSSHFCCGSAILHNICLIFHFFERENIGICSMIRFGFALEFENVPKNEWQQRCGASSWATTNNIAITQITKHIHHPTHVQ